VPSLCCSIWTRSSDSDAGHVRGGKSGDGGVNLPPAKEVADWYNLFRRIIDDIRSVFRTDKARRLALYEELFATVRFIHVDYISFFQAFIDELVVDPDKNLRKAKRKFLRARTRHAYQRTLTKFDALNLLSLTNDISELRLLTAILWYFHYSSTTDYVLETHTRLDANMWFARTDQRGGDGAWDSASASFWYKIEDCESGEEARQLAEELMSAVNQRFLTIMQSYTQLEASWKLGRKPIQTIISKKLVKVSSIDVNEIQSIEAPQSDKIAYEE
jgi:hypothetical protein